MDVPLHAFRQRQPGDVLHAPDIGRVQLLIRGGKIADGPEVEDPVYIALEEPGQGLRLRQVSRHVLHAELVEERDVLARPGG